MLYLIQIAVFGGSMFAAAPYLYGTPLDNKFVYVAIGVVASWLTALVTDRLRPPTA
jgi:hypothetical protein